jgi:hypothetical protein
VVCQVSLTLVPEGKVSPLGLLKRVRSGLDLSRCVKGVLVSNSPLDFKQFRFIRVIQVLGGACG